MKGIRNGIAMPMSETTFIYTSFNRFNFFDSDAASNFSQSNNEKKVKEALENLILGGEFKYLKERVNGFATRLQPEFNHLSYAMKEARENF